MTRTTHAVFTPPLEKIVHRHVIDLFKRLGTVVYSTSQYRASHVAVGFPDLWCMHPRLAKAWFWEVKKYRKAGFHPMKPETWVPESLRPEQAMFREHCLATGILHGWGGTSEAITFAEQIGLITPSRRSATAGRPAGVTEVWVEANIR